MGCPPTLGASKPASSEVVSTESTAAVTPWPPPGRAPAASACEPYREIIERAVGLGRNAMAIYQDLVSEHGLRAKYASVRRFVAKLRAQKLPEAHVVIHTEAGQEGQVDYGEGPMVRQPETGKYRRTRLFVFTLGHSRKSVRLLSASSRARAYGPSCTSEPFAGWAGRRAWWSSTICARACCKPGLLRPDAQPALRRRPRALRRRRSAVPRARSRPEGEGRIGRRARAARRRCSGLRFETIEEAQTHLDRWDDELGRHAHPRHDEAPGRRDVCGGAAVICCRCRSSLSATTSTASAPCISTATSRSTAPTTARRRDMIGARAARPMGRATRAPARSARRSN